MQEHLNEQSDSNTLFENELFVEIKIIFQFVDLHLQNNDYKIEKLVHNCNFFHSNKCIHIYCIPLSRKKECNKIKDPVWCILLHSGLLNTPLRHLDVASLE